jgi:antitoxin CptB
MREVDLILGPFADRALPGLDPAGLDAYEALLSEADTDLIRWLSGRHNSPGQHRQIIGRIRALHRAG